MSEPATQLPPLPWLRAFEAAARHGSFTAAASELNLTPAAVSHQVRSLEQHLGVVLFERLARNLRLTELASAYLPPLRHAFDELTAATVGLFGPIGKRSLAIRAPVSFAALWLAPRLGDFTRAYPDIGLRISSVVWAASAPDTAVDVEIRFGDGIWPGHHVELLANHPASVVCRPDRLPTSVSALAAQRLIHVTGYQDLWQVLFRRHEVAAPRSPGLDVDTSLAALELCAAGYGPAIVLDCFTRPLIGAGRLVRALDDRLPIEPSHYLLLSDSPRRRGAEAMLFVKWIQSAMRDDTPS